MPRASVLTGSFHSHVLVSACKFKCDNGKCLYNTDQICNRVNDCGPDDDSDEMRLCSKCNLDAIFV